MLKFYFFYEGFSYRAIAAPCAAGQFHNDESSKPTSTEQLEKLAADDGKGH